MAQTLQARIRNFPISFFAVSMGVTGCVIALQKVGPLLGLPPDRCNSEKRDKAEHEGVREIIPHGAWLG